MYNSRCQTSLQANLYVVNKLFLKSIFPLKSSFAAEKKLFEYQKLVLAELRSKTETSGELSQITIHSVPETFEVWSEEIFIFWTIIIIVSFRS